ncbi:MAG: efflux RND transporter permease subunit [Proteobacteria bacterium]|nr:efflux RND transporter permease subunit [Pseudomonadota bacterium]
MMLLIFFIGLNAYRTLPREAAPEVQIPYLIVTVPYPGSSPKDVESLIVDKLETEMKNLDELKELSSTSTEGAGMIALEYHLGTDIEAAKTEVRDALDRVTHELPEDAEDPIITEINTADFPIMTVNLSGTIGLFQLKEIAEEVKDRIEKIPGILEVKRTGGLEREVKIDVDPDKLRYFNVDLNQVSNAIAYENANIPAGDIAMGPLKYMIRVPGEITSPDDIRKMVITAPNQIPVFTKDVAKVKFGFKEVTSRSRYYTVESVSLNISKRSGENLLFITDQVKKIISEKQEKYGNIVSFTIISDYSDYVKKSVKDLENNIYTGLCSVLLVLILILGVRSSFFVAAAIPFSMLISFLVIQTLGLTMNMIVLFGLIMALGMLVDNAIVVVENIYRHLELGLSPQEAAKTGVGEVAIPVTTSTITTLVAFFPLLFMPGIMGDFMSYMPITLIITLSASLFVGLVINPVLCSSIMRRPKKLKFNDELKIAENSRVLRTYRSILNWSLGNRSWIVVTVLIVWIAIAIIYFKMVLPKAGVEFFPTSEPDHAVIHIEAPFGTTLDNSDKMVKKVEEVLLPYYGKTDSIVANVGQPRGSFSTGKTTHLSHLVTAFPDWETRTVVPSVIIKQIREILDAFSGAKYRITKAAHGPPTGKPVNIDIRGNDLIILKKVSMDIQKRVKNVPGLVNLADNFAANRSEIQVIIDREKTARLGLRTIQIASILRTAFNGKTVSTYRVDKDEYDIVVRLDKRFRKSTTNLENLYIKTPMGESVSLSELAEIRSAVALGSIRHIGPNRVITVSADAEGASGAVVLQRVQKELADFRLPAGYSIKYSGENESQKEMEEYLPKSFGVAIFLIFLVLVTQFNSLALPFVIVTSVFLSFMGVFLGMIIHNSPLSIMMGGIGIISLAGVVVNNAIVLIDYIQQLRKRGKSRHEAIVLGGMLRLRPVLLTALTTILALMPITLGLDVNFARSPVVLFGSESGQMWLPMAQGVIYGLGVATVLTLIVVPVLYSLIESGRERFSSLFGKRGSTEKSPIRDEVAYSKN